MKVRKNDDNNKKISSKVGFTIKMIIDLRILENVSNIHYIAHDFA